MAPDLEPEKGSDDGRRAAVAGLDDGDLARRIAAAGQTPAAEEETELCRRFARRVYHYGLRHLRAEDRARDLVQEVLLLTLAKLRSGAVREPERIGSFILGTARLVTRSLGRSSTREASMDSACDGALSVEPTRADPIAREHVARCLEALQERQRTVVVLTYYAEQGTADIASTLGLSANNVRVIRHRGLASLRSCLGVDLPGAA
jgi:RNA polymerase sigma-70 factor (ECF subfamily)